MKLTGEHQAGGSRGRVFGRSREGLRWAPSVPRDGESCPWETLTSTGAFPNYNLHCHTPAYSCINHYNRAGIPNCLPKCDLKCRQILGFNRAVIDVSLDRLRFGLLSQKQPWVKSTNHKVLQAQTQKHLRL